MTISVGVLRVIVFMGQGRILIISCLVMHVLLDGGHNSIISAVVPAVFLFKIMLNGFFSVLGLNNDFAGVVHTLLLMVVCFSCIAKQLSPVPVIFTLIFPTSCAMLMFIWAFPVSSTQMIVLSIFTIA